MWGSLWAHAIAGTLFLGACTTRCHIPEIAVTKAITILMQAEGQYYEATGRYGTIEQLARDKLIPRDLASGIKGGYRFDVRSSRMGYVLISEPLNGRGRHFYADESLQIREEWDRPATSQSVSLK